MQPKDFLWLSLAHMFVCELLYLYFAIITNIIGFYVQILPNYHNVHKIMDESISGDSCDKIYALPIWLDDHRNRWLIFNSSIIDLLFYLLFLLLMITLVNSIWICMILGMINQFSYEKFWFGLTLLGLVSLSLCLWGTSMVLQPFRIRVLASKPLVVVRPGDTLVRNSRQ